LERFTHYSKIYLKYNYKVIQYKNVAEAYILGNNEDMITRLDDTLLTLNNIMASRFVEGIRGRVEI
jgi:hypothetical protein